jgi:hypothetical protein
MCDDPQEGLSKFGYKLNMKIRVFEHLPFFGYLLEPCIEIWQSFLHFSLILGIESLKNT